MKKLVILLLAMVAIPFFNACTLKDESLSWGEYSLNSEKQRKFQESLLIDLKNSRPKEFNDSVQITESKVEKIEGIFYLRTFYNNGFVSTTLLKNGDDDEKDETDKTLEFGETTCTSESCASGGGCLPNLTNPYCSPCTKGTSDCIRSTK